ncbi:MAG: peptidoglycan editing factor PgeF [Candidatus Rokuibacteriota bacterium]|nr:MAG: peptidoglycan editing factor PgeF [Candidatus Rokubacteria bacterium]
MPGGSGVAAGPWFGVGRPHSTWRDERAWRNGTLRAPESTERLQGEPPTYFGSPLLTEARVPHLFSTRHFPGVRPWRHPDGPFEAAALARFGQHGLGSPHGEPVAYLRQVHGAEVVVVEHGGLAGQGDVLVTRQTVLPLAIFTADCLPIILYDPVGRRLALAHAGWRGTVEAVARVAVGALTRAGGTAKTFLAAIGPSIGPCCYEVDEPVIDRLAAAFPAAWQQWVTAVGAGKWMLDLWHANEDQLKAAGLESERIDNPRLCTSCRMDLFFSYRRGRGQGRLVAVAAIPGGRGEAC